MSEEYELAEAYFSEKKPPNPNILDSYLK